MAFDLVSSFVPPSFEPEMPAPEPGCHFVACRRFNNVAQQIRAWVIPRPRHDAQEPKDGNDLVERMPQSLGNFTQRGAGAPSDCQGLRERCDLTYQVNILLEFSHMLPRGSDTVNSSTDSTASNALALRGCLGFATVARPFVATHFGQRAKNESRSKKLVITCDQSFRQSRQKCQHPSVRLVILYHPKLGARCAVLSSAESPRPYLFCDLHGKSDNELEERSSAQQIVLVRQAGKEIPPSNHSKSGFAYPSRPQIVLLGPRSSPRRGAEKARLCWPGSNRNLASRFFLVLSPSEGSSANFARDSASSPLGTYSARAFCTLKTIDGFPLSACGACDGVTFSSEPSATRSPNPIERFHNVFGICRASPPPVSFFSLASVWYVAIHSGWLAINRSVPSSSISSATSSANLADGSRTPLAPSRMARQ